MIHWNPYTKWWLAWGLMFLVIEASAIAHRKRHDGGTLSSLVWRFIDMHEHPIQRTLFVVGWLVLSLHFLWHFIDY